MGTLIQTGIFSASPRLQGTDLKIKSKSKATVGVFRAKKHMKILAVVPFQNLHADDFRHPLDRQNTTMLQAIPGLAEVGRFFIGSTAEQLMVLDNIGSSVLAGEDQLEDLHKLISNAAKILDVETPDLYVRQSPVPNAYTLAVSGRKPFVVIHTSLVELLTRTELQAVLAHELGHLKCDHGIWLTFAAMIAMGAYALPGLGVLLASNLEEQVKMWVRAAELTCDRAALLVVQDPKVVISVLMKFAGGCPSLSGQLNVDAFLRQSRSYEEASQNPLGWYLRDAQTRYLSHPVPVLRAWEIDQWSKSGEYKALLTQASKVATAKSSRAAMIKATRG